MNLDVSAKKNNVLSLNGDLTRDSVPNQWHNRGKLCASQSEHVVDLAGVSQSDTAGLAYLYAIYVCGQEHGGRVQFVNIPNQLIGLAKISGLSEMFSDQSPENVKGL